MQAKLFFILYALTSVISAKEPSILTVSGYASLHKPADQLNMSVGVVTEGESAEEALKSNGQKMHAVLAILEEKGFSKKEFSTGQFNITPIYSTYPQNPPPDWSPKIIGYRVSNILEIKTDKLPQAGEIIDSLSLAGANSIDQISFKLKDAQQYRQEAIQSATELAMKDAKSLAAAADIELGRIRQIQLDNATAVEPRFKAFSASLDRSTPIEASEVAINAKVTIVYEIEH